MNFFKKIERGLTVMALAPLFGVEKERKIKI